MRRRPAIALIVVVAVLVAGALALRWAMRPQALGPRVLDMAGTALGLEITADGFDYRLAGGPRLVARGVAARVPGATAPMLQAGRVLVSVPWSTVRARGADPVVTRIELDAPVVQLQPFLGWWSQRSRGDGPLPTLREGLHIDRGRIDGGGWTVEDVAITLPHFSPDARVAGSLRGRWQADTAQAPFDLQVAMTRPAPGAGIGIAGTVTPRSATWRLPSRVLASARLGEGDGLRLQGMQLASASRYLSGGAAHPFALGVAGEGSFADGVLALEPAAVVLRGQDLVPRLHGRGRLALGQALGVALSGRIERWPDAWPALPPPLAGSDAPLPFDLGYEGPTNLSAPATLRLQYDQARFEGRFRATDITGWISDAGAGSPVPPLDGRVTAPRLEVGGAQLHGVEVVIEGGEEVGGLP